MTILDGLGITMILPLLDNFNVNQGSNTPNQVKKFLGFFGFTGSSNKILLFIILFFIVKTILKFINGFYKSKLIKNLFLHLKLDLMTGMQHVDYQYFTDRNVGHFITISSNHIQRFVISLKIFSDLIVSIITTLGYLVFSILISWESVIFAIILGIIGYYFFLVINRYVLKLSKTVANEQKKMNQINFQFLNTFKYLISTGTSNTIFNQYNSSVIRLSSLKFKNDIATAFTSSIKDLMIIISLTLIIGFELFILDNSIGSIAIVFLFFYRCLNQLLNIQNRWQKLIFATGFLESVDKELENVRAKSVEDGLEILNTPLNESVIQFNKVSFQYKNAKESILQNLSLSINPNSTVALMGVSGVGKTTLIDMLTGLLNPTIGTININNTPLKKFQLNSIRSKIGYVTQDLNIYDTSISNNITLFNEDTPINEIEKIAKMAFADEFINKLPEKYNTRVGDKGIQLSGGQKQRLFLARELFKKPHLLILDEATSALDSESEEKITKSINSLKGKITIIIIAHRISTIKKVDKIFIFGNGGIIEEGSYEELLKKQKASIFYGMIEKQSLT